MFKLLGHREGASSLASIEEEREERRGEGGEEERRGRGGEEGEGGGLKLATIKWHMAGTAES